MTVPLRVLVLLLSWLSVSKVREGLPRLAFTRVEAAASIGMSLDSFERYVQPDLRLIRPGRMRLVPVAELERWVEQNAARTIEPNGNGRR